MLKCKWNISILISGKWLCELCTSFRYSVYFQLRIQTTAAYHDDLVFFKLHTYYRYATMYGPNYPHIHLPFRLTNYSCFKLLFPRMSFLYFNFSRHLLMYSVGNPLCNPCSSTLYILTFPGMLSNLFFAEMDSRLTTILYASC